MPLHLEHVIAAIEVRHPDFLITSGLIVGCIDDCHPAIEAAGMFLQIEPSGGDRH